jgi:hypothetical protein
MLEVKKAFNALDLDTVVALLSGDRAELVEDCRGIREELFRHLSYVENLELNIVQNFLSLIVNAVTIILIILSIALSFNVFSNIPNVPALQAIANTLIYVAFFAVLVWFYRRHIKPALNSKVEVIRGLRLEHMNALKEYLNKLKSCCELLCEQECASSVKSVCADLERLEGIVRHLESREQRTATSILQCLLNLLKPLARRSP